MNDKFFSLPKAKQEAIINAGFRVFSENCYKKSPMSEIAAAAGISKSLLFHYFYNKRELYFFLWDQCMKATTEALEKNLSFVPNDLFEMMYKGLKIKADVMRRYPDLGAFVVKSYYEKDPDVCEDLQKLIAKYTDFKASPVLAALDPEQFIPGLDLQMMYRTMYWASEGYLWEKVQQGGVNADEMEADFIKIIDFWKTVYTKQ
ncbi:MAG: TetR/AcrR family transcriptional regulator [Lachnospiraceae bacterium]|nr:TetR/AcrR family transcriptional regulator [Lachnospiraceae bacterium]MBD5516699.1 TetR/AcrR family transcriptional regulator [Lachnospiraceae bacterium]MBD5525937.1 TetR/AcrR family transcriptional regulator [Lachnospiraceae bacterium]